MRYSLIAALVLASSVLLGCSSSDGEEGFFFDRTPALTSLVLDLCQTTPENTGPFSILSATFGSTLASTPESTEPLASSFSDTCLQN